MSSVWLPVCQCRHVAAGRIEHWWQRCSSADWRRPHAPLPSGTSALDRCQYPHNKLHHTSGPLSLPAPLERARHNNTNESLFPQIQNRRFVYWHLFMMLSGYQFKVPALSGRGTPPTKMVLRGSSGWEPSITKSLSLRFHGRIWT